tara:strand:- start:129 stop:899 length:771 start_codon:yes stop_codon:yes gene_type:complete
VEATYIPRAKLAECKNREGLNTVGIYFLVGLNEEHEKSEVYIGEAENCLSRLIQHNSGKDFWNYAIVVTSRTNQFTKTHGKYLEWHSMQKGKDVKRCHINNNITPSKPYVSEPMEADLLDSFDTISILVSTLGLPIFQPTRSLESKKEQELTFEISRKGVLGYGLYTEEGFVVTKGSHFNKTTTSSVRGTIEKKRHKLISDNILIDCGKYYELQEDIIFNSPSTAGACVTGRSTNGWTAWKLKDGRTLSDIYRSKE